MKQCRLCNPFVSSLVMLGAISILIGLMLSSGGFFAGIWAFIVMIFRTIQLSIALTIGIIVCLAFLIGIFLAAVAVYEGKLSAINKFEGLRAKFMAWFAMARSLCSCSRGKKVSESLEESPVVAGFSELVDDIQEEVSEAIESVGPDIAVVREEFEKKLEALESQLKTVESSRVTAEHVKETVASEISNVRDAVGVADAGLKELHTRMEVVAGEVAAIKANDIIGDIPVRLEKLEKQEIPEPVDLQSVQNQITALQAEVAALSPVPSKSQGKSEQDDEHRLLSYYDNPTDKQKISDLVTQTMKKDMTYAQVMDFLIENMGEEGGQVISGHPSLTKDYIRQCRRNA